MHLQSFKGNIHFKKTLQSTTPYCQDTVPIVLLGLFFHSSTKIRAVGEQIQRLF